MRSVCEPQKKSNDSKTKILNEKSSKDCFRSKSIGLAKAKPLRQKSTDHHYLMQTVKNEPKTSGQYNEENRPEVIAFVLAENDEKAESDDDDATLSENLLGEQETNSKDILEHVCSKCYKSFRRLKSLRKHMDFCQYDSGYQIRKEEMIKNIEKIEKDALIMEKKDICFCCGESYDTCHLGHINCPDCPKSFKTQSSYERHIFITHSELTDTPCSICNAKLRTPTLHKLHEEQHKTRGKPFACKICGKDFTRAYHLKRHQKFSSCSVNSGDAMSCKVCDRVFFRLDNLRSHLKQHLGTVVAKKPEYMCHICKNCFYSLSTLNIHIRTHTGEKPFDCDLCDKKFSALVALKKHRRYHTGEKPYSCQECNQSFAVKEVLNRHMKRHTGERPHKCIECGKSFIQATQLRTHSKTHVKPFECTYCGQKFKTEKQLQRHQKEHTKSRRPRINKCNTCKLRFQEIGQLEEHMIKENHKELEKPKSSPRTDCAICDKNFDSIEMLKIHIIKVHDCDPDDIFGTNSEHTRTALLNAKKPKLLNKKFPVISNNSTLKSYQSHSSGTALSKIPLDYLRPNSVPTQNNSIETYTVINVNELGAVDVKPSVSASKRSSKLECQGLVRTNMSPRLVKTQTITSGAVTAECLDEEDLRLKENISRLLDMLVDKATLKKFGWPNSSEEHVLCKVIENCGYKLNKKTDYRSVEYGTRMREYTKLLFSVVIQNEIIRELLNNYSIDDVIDYVLNDEESDEE